MANLRAEIEAKLNTLNSELSEVTSEIELSRQADNEEDVAVTRDLLDKKAMLIQQISDFTEDLENYKVTDSTSVDMGNSVKLSVNGSHKEITIVPSAQADPSRGYISVSSPLGNALVGKRKGESFVFETPAGKQAFEVVEIK